MLHKMNFIFKYVFFSLLGTNFAPALCGITHNADGSIVFTEGKAFMKIGPDDALDIHDGSSSILRDSDGCVKMRDGKSLFEMKDSGAFLQISDKTTLIEKNDKRGTLKLADGNTCMEVDNQKQTFVLKDRNSLLKKDTQSSTLVDRNSSIVEKSDGSLTIIDGKTSLKKGSEGSVDMVDGNTVLSIKGKSVTMSDGNSSLKKGPKGQTELKDRNTSFTTDVNGNVKSIQQDSLIIITAKGAVKLIDENSKLSKDGSGKVTASDGKTTLVKTKNYVQVVLRLSENEKEDLEIKIQEQKLIIDGTEEVPEGKGWRLFTITIPVPQSATEKQVILCHMPDGILNVIYFANGGNISCPKKATKSETLEEFNTSLNTLV